MSTLVRATVVTVSTWSRTALLTESNCSRATPVSEVAASASWRAYWWLTSTTCWMSANWRSTASVRSIFGSVPTVGKERNCSVAEVTLSLLTSTTCWMSANWRSTASVRSIFGSVPTVGKERNCSVAEVTLSFQVSSEVAKAALALRVASA